MAGKFYGVGVGPGDPELMTLKAKRVLEEVDIICTPKSAVGKESIALSIVEEVLGGDLEIKELIFPMTHNQDKLNKFWDEATAEIKEELEQEKDVAFITIGDPLLYSTYIYVLRRLEKNTDIEIETVPGINSYSACSAAMNRPLAEKNETVAIIPAAYDYDNLDEILANFDNTVLMKVARNFDDIVAKLDKVGITENSFYASRCGREDEFITTDLKSLCGEDLDYLSMVITKQSIEEE
ncbi:MULTISPECIES: precorrin-2 C(20)-methyltransferase [unclassified Candidatus Frackibacter]|uniref:precorrin-2 C(20)-methyltransferase n=1 Tax=unclassified Candidatus Frackibacter TaxID=2648818 RepID=UPI000798C298|nr:MULTISPECIES: precorrin-2 C(20)-methyltransferase [unclassified Candidatus Frackibacter]KXS43887.1 MAG: precorrin-2/cobalt-factor-2 C20-methyltransferase [Candidatus Frackibacter sp. T328-2]SDC33925.1 precorrin-2/cobalt-factor-2 C20-methyltransferase [Candidatus Frackibacter sp. WG11]SEM57267.1 precorrin-2/cobalt-factor-2 C20-methyltransferase [Candidatus Frackibacter sp. WG12]SFL69998.1 precorrin-2/cobalt-factor-2 C20-methyltransferase [Candidatus Frackibacter sp. WG13]